MCDTGWILIDEFPIHNQEQPNIYVKRKDIEKLVLEKVKNIYTPNVLTRHLYITMIHGLVETYYKRWNIMHNAIIYHYIVNKYISKSPISTINIYKLEPKSIISALLNYRKLEPLTYQHIVDIVHIIYRYIVTSIERQLYKIEHNIILDNIVNDVLEYMQQDWTEIKRKPLDDMLMVSVKDLSNKICNKINRKTPIDIPKIDIKPIREELSKILK